MSADRRRQAAEAFWRDGSGPEEKAQAIGAIAQRLKFRTKSAAVLPIARKIQYLLDLPAVPEPVAAKLLVSYHVEHQCPMMAAFLDALGVKHVNGIVDDDTVIPKDPDKIRAAVKALAASYPAEDVALYLSTLSWQDHETWAILRELAETRLPG
jgi:hypothetical protein